MPFALWADYGWVTPAITAIVTFLLLGVENIGIQIEEPFEVLPLQAMSAACIAGVHEIMDRHTGELTKHCTHTVVGIQKAAGCTCIGVYALLWYICIGVVRTSNSRELHCWR